MTNEEKLEGLKAFLTENGIKFIENYKSGLHVLMDLKLPDYMIAVHLSDDKDDEFYHRTFRQYKPFFIRESETPDFIIEKMQNCITDIMVKRQKIYEKKQKKEEGKRIAAEYERRHQEKLAARAAAEKPKRKRVRIQHFEKVEPRRKDEVQG